MKEKLHDFLREIRFLFKILSWKEYWIIVSVPLSIFGVWIIFWLTLYLPVLLRFIIMWGIIIGLAFLSPRLSKRQ